MGVRASLTQIPSEIPKLLREAREYEPSEHTLGAQYDWNSFPSVTLDKAWQDFVVVFKKIGPPLHYAIEGDYSHPDSIETWDYETSDYYTGYVSKEHVQGVSSALSKLSYSDISSAFEQAGIEYDEYNQRYFEGLICFYQEAAKKHSAVMILIA
jgi:hypothetical protein